MAILLLSEAFLEHANDTNVIFLQENHTAVFAKAYCRDMCSEA